MSDQTHRPHPRHPDGPCPAYDPSSLPGKGPAEIRADLRINYESADVLPADGWRGINYAD